MVNWEENNKKEGKRGREFHFEKVKTGVESFE